MNVATEPGRSGTRRRAGLATLLHTKSSPLRMLFVDSAKKYKEKGYNTMQTTR
jgi:hypothetical protein